MTSSNGNIFRVTGAFWGEFPSQKASNAGFDIFFYVRLINFKQTVESPVIWDARMLIVMLL